jgi:hypothetical protein
MRTTIISTSKLRIYKIIIIMLRHTLNLKRQDERVNMLRDKMEHFKYNQAKVHYEQFPSRWLYFYMIKSAEKIKANLRDPPLFT